MISIWREADCSERPLRGWTLGIFGYGNQGRAQALNLRDSGHTVVVVARPQGKSSVRAAADGFAVLTPDRVADAVDLLAVLTPDETHHDAVEALARAMKAPVDAADRPGEKPEKLNDRGETQHRLKVLLFAHGFALRFDPPELDPRWDVLLLAPAGPGNQLRERYLEGGGIPAQAAVHQDGSGEGEERLKAYGAAVGCARAGLLQTTTEAEAEIDLFGEQVVVCGGMNALCRTAFETLVRAGYPEELAYLECVHQLRLTAELVERYGVEGMRRRISPLALFGDLTRGKRIVDPGAARRMEEILREIRSGAFAREYLEKTSHQPDWREDDLRQARSGAQERAGRIIRELHERGAPGQPGGGEGADKGIDNPPGLG